MDLILTIIRLLTSIAAPLLTVFFAIVVLLKTDPHDESPQSDQICIHCKRQAPGDIGEFSYTQAIHNSRNRSAEKSITTAEHPLLGTERHFVCDRCARKRIANEVLQSILMALPYPLYLHVILPLFAPDGHFARFLVETFLIVLSVAGLVSALNVYRGTRLGQSPLAETRDQVAINACKKDLGDKLNYHTRAGVLKIKK